MWSLVYVLCTDPGEPTWVIPLIGFCCWYLTGNAMHDGSHAAFSTKPWINRMAAHAAFPFGINQVGWTIEHVMSHHIFTNEEHDVDLYHFEPVVVLQKGLKSLALPLHLLRLVWILSSSIIHLGVVVPYGLIFGHVDPAHGHRTYDRVKAIGAHRAEMKVELIVEFVAMLGAWGALGSCMGAGKFFAYGWSIMGVHSLLFAFFTQVSH